MEESEQAKREWAGREGERKSESEEGRDQGRTGSGAARESMRRYNTSTCTTPANRYPRLLSTRMTCTPTGSLYTNMDKHVHLLSELPGVLKCVCVCDMGCVCVIWGACVYL
jgi:hypothetical protein